MILGRSPGSFLRKLPSRFAAVAMQTIGSTHEGSGILQLRGQLVFFTQFPIKSVRKKVFFFRHLVLLAKVNFFGESEGCIFVFLLNCNRMLDIRRVQVSRYAQPLREGGSMPGLVEGDDGFLYVMKFRSAGQGRKALIAELLGGEIARKLGAKMPELVYLDLPEGLAKTEADEEIQDLLQGSVGLNVGLSFLSQAMTFDPQVTQVSQADQALILWLDAYILNVDRTIRNPNLLIWFREPWLIDHGAAFFFHHQWENWERYIHSTFPQGKDHVVWSPTWDRTYLASKIEQSLTSDWLASLVQEIPEDWLLDPVDDVSPDEKRQRYLAFLVQRRTYLLENPHVIYPL